VPGVYSSWDDVRTQTNGFANAKHKRYPLAAADWALAEYRRDPAAYAGVDAFPQRR